jgi:hypothetical protein
MEGLFCDRGALHEGEPLNRVCVEAECGGPRLLCVMCEEAWHKGHATRHLRSLLEDLQERNSFRVNELAALTFELDRAYLEYLGQLREVRASLNSELDALEQCHRREYDLLKDKVLHCLEVVA